MKKAEIKAWAMDNYENSFFASSIIECWGDEDFETVKDMDFLLSLKDAVDEQYLSAQDW